MGASLRARFWLFSLVLVATACLVALCASAALATTYYIDSVSGDDTRNGTSPATAWRTVGKVNATTFAPGDQILLNAGCAWTGQLWPKGSGAEGSPIIVDMYETGNKPLMNADGLFQSALYLHNQQYWEVSNLELTNYHQAGVDLKHGALVVAEDVGTLHHIHLTDLVVHDIRPTLNWDDGAIHFQGLGAETGSSFNDVLIEGCTIYDVDQSGVYFRSTWWDRSLAPGAPGCWVPNTNVVVRGNSIANTGTCAIITCVCDAPLIEHNVASNCGAVAIWPWASDDAVVQYNEAYGTKATYDGEGFNSDWFSNDTIIQYNYSHDNMGGFCLICAKGDYDGFNDGTIVRYNVSQNDYRWTFRIAGPCTNTEIYNNTVYIGPGVSLEAVVYHQDWSGYPDHTAYRSNIFYHLGSGGYDFRSSTDNIFDYNLFYGGHPAGEPADPHKLTSDPKLVSPGSAGIGMDTCDGYKLQPDSPCIDSGATIADSGDLDYWGNPVPSGLGVDRGAHEYLQFPDVPTDYWAFEDIGFCVGAGVVQGYDDGLYRPDVAVSRDQMAVFISRALAGGDDNVPDGPETPTFPDVLTNHWAYKYIEHAHENGIVLGYEDGLYHPTDSCNRDQMAAFIARSMCGGDDQVPDEPCTWGPFPDVPCDQWARRYIEYIAQEGVTAGYPDGRYHPEYDCGRGPMAVFISRAFDLPL